MSALKALAKLGTGLIGLGSEYIEDKDKRNEFSFKVQEMIHTATDSARDHDKASYGITFVDAIRGLIRPVITLAMSANYVINRGENFNQYDYMVLGVVLTFWFGGRELQKLFKK